MNHDIPVPQKYGVGQTQAPQLPTLQGLATVAHAPPTVSCSFIQDYRNYCFFFFSSPFRLLFFPFCSDCALRFSRKKKVGFEFFVFQMSRKYGIFFFWLSMWRVVVVLLCPRVFHLVSLRYPMMRECEIWTD